jgi:hypothetical protein
LSEICIQIVRQANVNRSRKVIWEVNQKFKDGCANQDTGLRDKGRPARHAKLEGSQRKAMKEGVAHKIINNIVVTDPNNHVTTVEQTLIPTRAHETAIWLEKEETATIGNCGERAFYGAHLLRKAGAANVSILTGATKDSINHDFIVIGATDIAPRASYSQSLAPAWNGTDIVICDAWFQSSVISYACGLAYPLAGWPKWMPDIIASTVKGNPTEKTLNRTNFILTIIG